MSLKPAYKWIHAFQIHIVQGSTAVLLHCMYLQRPKLGNLKLCFKRQHLICNQRIGCSTYLFVIVTEINNS